jgi:hypothetical protein
VGRARSTLEAGSQGSLRRWVQSEAPSRGGLAEVGLGWVDFGVPLRRNVKVPCGGGLEAPSRGGLAEVDWGWVELGAPLGRAGRVPSEDLFGVRYPAVVGWQVALSAGRHGTKRYPGGGVWPGLLYATA